MSEEVIRVSGMREFLAIPARMLGFAPQEAIVVMALKESEVAFVARFDLAELTTKILGDITYQIMQAFGQAGCTGLAITVYTEEPKVGAAWGNWVARILPHVVQKVIATSKVYWEGFDEPTGEGTPYSTEDTLIMENARKHGVNVNQTREDTVKKVERPSKRVSFARAAWGRATKMDPAIRADAAVRYTVTKSDLPKAEAKLVAAIFGVDRIAVERVIGELTRENAAHVFENMLTVYQHADEKNEGIVTSLVALVCWLAGEGAMFNELMTNRPHDPILREWLDTLHLSGISPADWDHLRLELRCAIAPLDLTKF